MKNFPHEKFLSSKHLQLRWKNRTFLDDIINSNEFSKQTPKPIISCHKCIERNGKGRYCPAYFLKTVSQTRAEFDYVDLPNDKKDKNTKNKIMEGKVIILFTDETRTVVKKVLWKDRDKNKGKEIAITSWDLPPSGEFKMPSKSTTSFVKSKRKVRYYQGRFRESLLCIYGRKCAISGCSIKETLEAAHIFPASDKSSYHPKNGLLLRADLHRLFEYGGLRVNPKTHKVVLSSEIQKEPIYAPFHGKCLRRPLHGYCPDNDVLRFKYNENG